MEEMKVNIELKTISMSSFMKHVKNLSHRIYSIVDFSMLNWHETDPKNIIKL